MLWFQYRAVLSGVDEYFIDTPPGGRTHPVPGIANCFSGLSDFSGFMAIYDVDINLRTCPAVLGQP